MSILSRTLASIPTAGDPGDPEDELSMVCGGHRVVRTDTPLALRRDRQPSSLTRGKRAGLAVAAQLSSLPFSVAGTEWVGQSNEQAGETPGRQSPPPRTRQLVPAPSIYPLLLHALHDPLWPSSSPHSPRGTYHKSCII